MRRDRAAAHQHRSAAGRLAPSPAHRGDSPVVRVIRDIERVVPAWALAALIALALAALAALVRSRLHRRRAGRLEAQRVELQGDVGALQRALLPSVPADLPGVTLDVAYRPADGPAAGGDFYDVVALDDGRTAIVVGDVCGHGRDAVAGTALVRYTLRTFLTSGCRPREALRQAGVAVDREVDAPLTTVVVAVYDALAGTLAYACAGHEPPLVLGCGARDAIIACSSPPLGSALPTGLRETTVPFGPGAVACLFTDGLVEGADGDRVGGRARLARAVAVLGETGAAGELLAEVPARDDVLACVVRARAGAAMGPDVVVEEVELDSEVLAGRRFAELLSACAITDADAARVTDDARAIAAVHGSAVVRLHRGVGSSRFEVIAPAGADTEPLGAAA